jgi:hypothetical protein
MFAGHVLKGYARGASDKNLIHYISETKADKGGDEERDEL